MRVRSIVLGSDALGSDALKNSVFEGDRVYPFDFDELGGSGLAREDGDVRGTDAGDSGEELDDGGVGLAIHWRGGDTELPGLAEASRELGSRRARGDLKRQARLHWPGCGRGYGAMRFEREGL